MLYRPSASWWSLDNSSGSYDLRKFESSKRAFRWSGSHWSKVIGIERLIRLDMINMNTWQYWPEYQYGINYQINLCLCSVCHLMRKNHLACPRSHRTKDGVSLSSDLQLGPQPPVRLAGHLERDLTLTLILILATTSTTKSPGCRRRVVAPPPDPPSTLLLPFI